jgi:hypothetical protein
MGHFKEKYGVVQNDLMMVNFFFEGGDWYSWAHKFNRLYTSSVIYHEKCLGRGGHLQAMILMINILKRHLFYVLAAMNCLF